MNVLMQLLSLFSRLVNVAHGGKANKTFSERTHDDQESWYFCAWRKVINAVGRLFGQAEHTLKVTLDEEEIMKRTLRGRGYRVELAPGVKPTASKMTPRELRKAIGRGEGYVPGDDVPTEQEKALQAMIDQIAQKAETYEMNQDMFELAWRRNEELFIEAAYHVDWPAVVQGYDDTTLHKVIGSGTEFNFPNNDSLRHLVMGAAKNESAIRTPPPRATNGMVE